MGGDAVRLSDRYQIEDELATGGMGTVYRGRDERLHRSVAIKVLKEHLSTDDRFVERFRREARAVASLTHPNIASLYDYGEDAGRHYIVMEFVEGRDLATLLQEDGPLGAEDAERIAAEVCDALAVAHAAGIVHRDVKPGNVLLKDDGTAKVTDFGIARATGDTSLTVTGSILGTAHYLAPEQAAGEPANPATDVYATGIVLFEMLTGRVPFTADSPIAVATRHMTDEVPPPSSLNPDIPARLDDIVRVATARNIGERYADAAAMGAALRGGRISGGAAASAAASTQVLPTSATRTTRLPVLGSTPFDARKLTLGVIGVLALMALALLSFRLLEDPAAEERSATPKENERESDAPVVPNVRGMPVAEAAAAVSERGLEVDVDGDDDGIVAGVEPEPGSEVTPGTTVTLTVAETEPDEEDEDEGDEGDDDEGRSPHSNGKGKGKGKDKEKKEK